jgi:hypothetical protein
MKQQFIFVTVLSVVAILAYTLLHDESISKGEGSQVVLEKGNEKNTLQNSSSSDKRLLAAEAKKSPEIPSANIVEDQNDLITEPNHSSLKSFTASLSKGDDRAPPIVRQAAQEQASQEELDDPAKYLDFQARQKQKVLVSYLHAAKPKLEKLRELVARGEAEGIAEDKLNEGRIKIQKIEEMVEEIKLDNPELAELN